MGLTLAQPLWLLLLLPMAAVLLYLWRRQNRQSELAGEGVMAPHLAKVFSRQHQSRAGEAPILLALILSVGFIVSLAQPSVLMGRDSSQRPLIIAIDQSSSMQDTVDGVSLNDRARLAVVDSFKRGIDRPVSVFAFSGSAHMLLPPTRQLDFVEVYLGYLSPQVMPVDGNNLLALGQVIDRSLPKLKTSGFDLWLISDGLGSNKNNTEAFNVWLNEHGAQVLIQSLNQQSLSALSGTRLSNTATAEQIHTALQNLSPSWGESSEYSNMGFWLLPLLALALLFWFRRGFTLHWQLPVLLLLLMPVEKSQAAEESWWNWFFSSDQRGAIEFKLGRYPQAAEHFQDPLWRAAAYYYAEDFNSAAEIYMQQGDLQSTFNLGNALAQDQRYAAAAKIFRLILDIDADYPSAEKNYRRVKQLAEQVQNFSEAQQLEKPPAEGNAKPSVLSELDQGVADQSQGQRQISRGQLSAEDLLASEQKTESWLRDISRDPAAFIGSKFSSQYRKQQAKESSSLESEVSP